MKKKISYWFLLGLAVWIFIVFLREKGIFIPIISNHLTDFITIPMYAYLIEYLINDIMGYHWKPDFKFIISSIVYLSLLFEVICPMLSKKFTGDMLDVVAYFIGGMGYYFFIIRSQRFFKGEDI